MSKEALVMWVVHAGNRVDAPDRQVPRFPAANVPLVEERLTKLFGELRPDGVVSAAASGADLLVLDAASRCQIPIYVSLPLPVTEFRRRSVVDGGEAWATRFDRIIGIAAEVRETDLSAHDDWYLRGNDVILGDAAALAGQATLLALVVRPAPGDEPPSATDDFAARAEARGLFVIDIDPSRAVRKKAFVVMPFDVKSDPADATTSIDFDHVFSRLFVPLLEDADLDWDRADRATEAGFVHTSMFEQLFAADVVVADVTFGNGNVLYELGIRHTLRPFSTMLVSRRGSRQLFDLKVLREFRYDLVGPKITDDEIVGGLRVLRPALATAALGVGIDSPVHELFEITPDITMVPRSGSTSAHAAARELGAAVDRAERTIRTSRLRHLDDAITNELTTLAEAARSRVADRRTRNALLFRLGSDLRQYGRYAEALVVLGHLDLTVDDGGFAALRKEQALCHRRLGEGAAASGTDPTTEWAAALTLLRDALGADTPDPDALGVAGGLAKRQAEAVLTSDGPAAQRFLRESLQFYERGVEFEPTNYYLHLNVVTVRRLLGTRFDDASALRAASEQLPIARYFARRAVDSNSGDAYAAASVGELAYTAYALDRSQQAHDDALQWYRRAVDVPASGDQLKAMADQLRIYRAVDTGTTDLLDRLEAVVRTS